MMSLWSLGIGKGDEVITSPTSFIATVGAIKHVGAKPVFVDIKNNLNIDEYKIEKKITKKTKAIMPVHWTGRMCDMEKITKLAKKYNLKIIEDAAQAMGSYYKGYHAGSFSEVAAFSSHPLKILNGLGDGGFITEMVIKFTKNQIIQKSWYQKKRLCNYSRCKLEIRCFECRNSKHEIKETQKNYSNKKKKYKLL